MTRLAALLTSSSIVCLLAFSLWETQAEGSELTDEDILIHYDSIDAIVGLTILNASQR